MSYQTSTYDQHSYLNNNYNLRFSSNILDNYNYYSKINDTQVNGYRSPYTQENKIINYPNYNNNLTYISNNKTNQEYLNQNNINNNLLEYKNTYETPILTGTTQAKGYYIRGNDGNLYYYPEKPINYYINNNNSNNIFSNNAKVVKITNNHINSQNISKPFDSINNTKKVIPTQINIPNNNLAQVKVLIRGNDNKVYNPINSNPNVINENPAINNYISNTTIKNNNINSKQLIPNKNNIKIPLTNINSNNQTNIPIPNNVTKINPPNVNPKNNLDKNINHINPEAINNNKILNNFNFNNNQPKQTNINQGIQKNMKDGQPNIPNSTPIKKRPLTDEDFKNIIYKDIGIINLGNTCYINSILQVLIHCPEFIYQFFNKKNSMNKDDTLICAYLYQVCKDMVDTVNTQQPYIDITNFKTVFGNKHPNFDGYLQNDSQEFCRVLLEDISNELNEIKNKVPYSQLTNSDRISKRQRDIQFDKNFKDREKSIITELFYSQVITTFKCQCKAEIYSFQKLLDFPLLLPVNKPKIDIKDLLKIYFKKEIIEFERPCEKCKKIEKHIKEIKISRPPEILILSLQRSDPITQKKNECIVTFPEILDITEFLDHECGHDSEPLYSLFAVINHSGSIDFGHYYSYIKFRNKGEWYLFNDSSVKKFGNTNPNFQQAYALFYIKKYINN